MQAILWEVFKEEEKPEIKGTTSRKEIIAWQSFFDGIVREKTGDEQGAEDAFRKAVGLCGSIKGALAKRKKQEN